MSDSCNATKVPEHIKALFGFFNPPAKPAEQSFQAG
jgi:hypothetical protein